MEIAGNPIDIEAYLGVTKDEIYTRIGYSPDVEPSARVASIVDEYITTAKQLIEPSYAYNIIDIKSVDPPRISVNSSIAFQSSVISHVLTRCTSVAVFALTIGGGLEEMAARLGEKELILEAFVLDIIGSTMTEKAADFVQGIIGEMANIRGMAISKRYSPGYCDWDIKQQELVFQALEGNNPGIKLSEDCLMTPEKSVSGIIGIGPSERGIATFNPCRTCAKKTCLWRR
ncbi:MAG: vitamin B12 dependent-methionine synthase activation domain-containing protein [Dehalococcoidia bacterium]